MFFCDFGIGIVVKRVDAGAMSGAGAVDFISLAALFDNGDIKIRGDDVIISSDAVYGVLVVAELVGVELEVVVAAEAVDWSSVAVACTFTELLDSSVRGAESVLVVGAENSLGL